MRLPNGTHTAMVQAGLILARRDEGVSRAVLAKMVPSIGWRTYYLRNKKTTEWLRSEKVNGIQHYWLEPIL